MTNRLPLIILILFAIILGWLGYSNMKTIATQNEIVKAWQADTTHYNHQLKEQQKLLDNLRPANELIKTRENALSNSLSDPYLNASQGVEVHLEGIRWMGQWFKAHQNMGIDKMGGIAEVQINQIVFDPDFEKAGMPDLNVEVTAPRFFQMNNFLNDWLQGFQLSGFLGKAFAEKKPVEIYDLETAPGKRQKMSLWLLEFDTFLRIEPSPDHDSRNIGNLEKHPVSGVLTDKIRKEQEAKNQRYGNVSVMLKFKPKAGTWYIADTDETGMLVANGEPKIGIAAVECIGIKPVSENKQLNNIGVYLRRGSSLALYNSPAEIDSRYNQSSIAMNDALMPINNMALNEQAIANPNLFGKEKYAIIHLTNLGSWQEGSWFSNVSRYADQYHARFVIHAYVLGEWNVQPVNIVKPKPRPAFSQKKAGLMDFLLPDFHLGWLGKLVSGGGWVIIGILILSLLFPPVGLLIKRIITVLLKFFKASVKS